MPSMPDPPRRKQMHARRHQEARYNSTQWRKYRRAFLAESPVCVECGRLAEVVDHIKPVRLGGAFWQPLNHQSLCHPCHNSKSGKEARTPHSYG